MNTARQDSKTSPRSSRCVVAGCRRPCRRFAWFCQGCLARLDDSAQFIVGNMLRSLRQPHMAHLPLTVAEYECKLEHYARRLAAELKPVLSAEEHAEADALTSEFHAFATFSELLDAAGGYWPKFYVSPKEVPAKAQRERISKLCDYYDRCQKLRGDNRRATRMV